MKLRTRVCLAVVVVTLFFVGAIPPLEAAQGTRAAGTWHNPWGWVLSLFFGPTIAEPAEAKGGGDPTRTEPQGGWCIDPNGVQMQCQQQPTTTTTTTMK